jgi:hypothetical protein
MARPVRLFCSNAGGMARPVRLFCSNAGGMARPVRLFCSKLCPVKAWRRTEKNLPHTTTASDSTERRPHHYRPGRAQGAAPSSLSGMDSSS